VERFVNTQAPWIVPAAPLMPFARTPSWFRTQLASGAAWSATETTGRAAKTTIAANVAPTNEVRIRFIRWFPFLSKRRLKRRRGVRTGRPRA
jgi:hypothetical protein